jgi:methylated-DNA-[protein]-cysteine S-methyltransferase
MSEHHLSFDSPVGPLTITERDSALIKLDWSREANSEVSPLLVETRRQLQAYFAGKITSFDLPVAPVGTQHQQKVWRAMQNIPYGGHQSYGAMSATIGSSARAVGTACGRNPIAIIIPCHRVLAAGGKIGGYSGGSGTATKRYLLSLEGVELNE